MSRKVQRVPYHLDAKGLRSLSSAELAAILRGADDLIMRGGRSLLVKVLRGSRARDVLDQALDQSPVYGYYRHLPDEDVLARIDWTILNGYLAIEYDYRLPLLVFTQRGWDIEKETYAEELLRGLDEMLARGQPIEMGHLKDRNREMIRRLLEKIQASGDRKYLPALAAWEQIDYKKVRQRIRQVIARLNGSIAGGPAPPGGPGSTAGPSFPLRSSQ
jgi:hypothetical protein